MFNYFYILINRLLAYKKKCFVVKKYKFVLHQLPTFHRRVTWNKKNYPCGITSCGKQRGKSSWEKYRLKIRYPKQYFVPSEKKFILNYLLSLVQLLGIKKISPMSSPPGENGASYQKKYFHLPYSTFSCTCFGTLFFHANSFCVSF